MAQEQMVHKLSLEGRKKLMLSGVAEVVSFEDTAVVLQTSLGMLVVHGTQLQLKQLSPEGGQVAVEGEVSALVYEEARSGGWLSRLFG